MIGRRTGQTLLAGGLLLTLATGCGVRPSIVITGRPAVSGPSQGIGLYLLRQGELVLVLRPAKAQGTPDTALALLAAGPDQTERGRGLTSEVPAGIAPVTSEVDQAGDLTVRTASAARALSENAVNQIVCTAADAAAQAGLVVSFAPVTIVGPDGTRPPQPCPIK
ncbi:hypothetical protein [Micromonospora chokoriensis]|uniref:hypothetical protein n=1 Tax=Micromonospora chokoriensis TaxID=356851 RepID=UPI000A79C1DC|nr:hypothetical protein [Micromonospora chokoriensis]